MRPPEDLREFWDTAIAELATVDMDAEMSPAPEHSSERALVYRVKLTSFRGERIRGRYAAPPVPEGVQVAGLLTMTGYNMTGPVEGAISWAEKGFATFLVVSRAQGPEQYPDGSKNKLVGGITDRYDYAYRQIFMDCLRGLDFLEAQPEVFPGKIAVAGGSQGGGLALATAALAGDRVAAAGSAMPFLGNLPWVMETKVTTNPYCELTDYLAAHPEHREIAAETLSCFDPMNLAPWITCPTFVVAGAQDERCPIETILPTFDAMVCLKQLMVDPEMGHGGKPDTYDHIRAWLARYL